MMDDFGNWRQVHLFHHLGQGKLQEILQLLPVRTVHRGDYLYRTGDPANELFILRSGAVKLLYITAAGREQIIDIVQPGGVLGDFFLSDTRAHLISAQALEDTVAHRLSTEMLIRLTERSPCLLFQLVHAMAYAQRQMVRRMQVLLQPVPEDRLLGVLFDLSGARSPSANTETWVVLPATITQEDIANLAALNRSTVSLLINRLRREGILGGQGRTLTINTARARMALQALGLDTGE